MIECRLGVAIDPSGLHRAANLCRPAGACPTSHVWALPVLPSSYSKSLGSAPKRGTMSLLYLPRQMELAREWLTAGAKAPACWQRTTQSFRFAAEKGDLRWAAYTQDRCRSRNWADDPNPRSRVAIPVLVRFRPSGAVLRRCHCVADCAAHRDGHAGADAGPRAARRRRTVRLR